ncbi:MAG: hypothetical protein HY049_05290 [Acidobacteria bacterium]|nr:hypothetical protein [Acidobacteriota bacterium]
MRARSWIPIAFAALSLGAAPARVAIDFDAAREVTLETGCAGGPTDWEIVRSMADPRDGQLRSLDATADRCLLAPGAPFADGAISARIAPHVGLAGFALRYRDPAHYIDVSVHLLHGGALVREHRGAELVTLGASIFKPQAAGWHEVAAAAVGKHLSVFVDGERVLDLAKATPGEGRAGPLTGSGARADFDDVVVDPWPAGDDSLVVSPAVLPAAAVGVRYESRLSCRRVAPDDPNDPRERECECSIASGSLPPGLTVGPGCRLSGVPRRSGTSGFELLARLGGSTSVIVPERVIVSGTEWPRFPRAGPGATPADLAIVYLTDDIGPDLTSLDRLGYPDRSLFRLHRDHPSLRAALMSCPDHRRKEGGPGLAGSPEAAAIWRRLATAPEFAWLELGGHGDTHAPDGDENFDHHEFSTTETGCNIDHALTGRRDYAERHLRAAREAYRGLGLQDDLVTVMRFPGVADNPEALRAAARAGFSMIVGSRHLDEPGREWWVAYPGGGEILEIEGASLQRRFYPPADLERRVAAGGMDAGAIRTDPSFQASVAGALAFVDGVREGGGILGLSDHFWETFQESGGVPVRYLVVDEALRRLETERAGAIWYPSAHDLALWLDARRNAGLTWRQESDGVHVAITAPPSWKERGSRGIAAASLLVRLPPGYERLAGVTLREEGAPARALAATSYAREAGGVVVTFPLASSVELVIRPARP